MTALAMTKNVPAFNPALTMACFDGYMRELNSFRDLDTLSGKLSSLENNVDSEKDPVKKQSMIKLIAQIKDQIADMESEKNSFISDDHRKIGEGEDLMFL